MSGDFNSIITIIIINSDIVYVGIVSSICKKVKIPHLVATFQPTNADDFNNTDSYTRNLFPDPKLFTKALYEIIKSFQWRTFAVIYDNNENLVKLNDAFTLTMDPNTMGKQKISFYKIPNDSDDFKPLLKRISKSGINQIVLDCSEVNIYSILRQSYDVNMMNEYVVSSHFFTQNSSFFFKYFSISKELFHNRCRCLYVGLFEVR